jgi:hypothetical protein
LEDVISRVPNPDAKAKKSGGSTVDIAIIRNRAGIYLHNISAKKLIGTIIK